MSSNLYDASVPLFLRSLRVLANLIDKAAASDLDEAALMQARLAPDMKPFPDQIRFAAFAGRSCVARLIGQAWPVTADNEASLSDLKATVEQSIAFIEGVDPAAFDGAATRVVELRFPGVELDFIGEGYLYSFAIPNFYFHVSMAYALLRQAGLPIGKVDYLGQLALTRPPKLG